MKKIWGIILLMLFICDTSKAQIKADLNYGSYRAHYSEIASEPVGLKNPNTAMWISVGSTIASRLFFLTLIQSETESVFLVMSASTFYLIAPSMGYLYTDNWDDFFRSSATRLGGTMLQAIGGIIIIAASLNHLFSDDDPYLGTYILGSAIGLTGLYINLNSMFKDFRQVRTKVDEYNEGLIKSVQLVPAVDPVNKGIGVGLRLNF